MLLIRISKGIVLAIPFMFFLDIRYLPAVFIFCYMVVEDYESQLIDMMLVAVTCLYLIMIGFMTGDAPDIKINIIKTISGMYMLMHGIRNLTAESIIPTKVHTMEGIYSLTVNKNTHMAFLPAVYCSILTWFLTEKYILHIPLLFDYSNQSVVISDLLLFTAALVYIAGLIYHYGILRNSLKRNQIIRYKLGDGDVYAVPVISIIGTGTLLSACSILWLATIYIIAAYILGRIIMLYRSNKKNRR